MKKALLIIGDKKKAKFKPARSFVTFIKHIDRFAPKNAEVKVVSYRDVLSGDLPIIFHPQIFIVLFFPFEFWNIQIENYGKDRRVYGDKHFGGDYEKFFMGIKKKIQLAYKNKHISYFNPPEASLLERDKKKAKLLLRRKGVPTPKMYEIKSPKSIYRILNTGKAVYIKPRFGAMGKGISYLKGDVWLTNFKYRYGTLVNRRSDFGWRFYRIPEYDKMNFLRELIRRDFIFEQAIESPVRGRKKFDFRVHVVYGETPYYYIRSVAVSAPVTNWTQGGRIEKKENFRLFMPADKLRQVRKVAVKAAKALGLNYAGIDIVISKDMKNIYCLEAHSFPGYEKGFDIMECVAKAILRKGAR